MWWDDAMTSGNQSMVKKIEEEKRNSVMGAIGEGKTFEEIVKTMEGKVSRSTITKHLKELEKTGYAVRVPIPGERRVEYRLTKKFKKTEYYQMKALALKEYLNLDKLIGNPEKMIHRVGESIHSFTLLALTDKKPEKYNIALWTYIQLFSNLINVGLQDKYPASKETKKNMERIKRVINTLGEQDIEKLLSRVRNKEERQAIKKVLFLT
jgi:DNA-binding HxlR family transcriptional regulator